MRMETTPTAGTRVGHTESGHMRAKRRRASRAAEEAGRQRRAGRSTKVAAPKKCAHAKRSEFGICIRCGDKANGVSRTHLDQREPSEQTHTEVIELASYSDVLAFAKRLLRVKALAPVSLRYTVAVTANRRVTFRGSRNAQPDITKSIT